MALSQLDDCDSMVGMTRWGGDHCNCLIVILSSGNSSPSSHESRPDNVPPWVQQAALSCHSAIMKRM